MLAVAASGMAAMSAPTALRAAPAEDPGFLYRGQFSAHEPVYFSVGFLRETDARFQFSFKYQFLRSVEETRVTDVLENLHFGYTQLSVWDIGEESAPFHDTNFKPSLFYRHERVWSGDGLLSAIDLEGGFEHESNGRGGLESRSLNVLYIKPTFVIGDRADWHVEIEPKLYMYVIDRSDNPDIHQYRGYADLAVRVGAPRSWQLAGTFRLGTDTDHYSMLLDLSVPIDNYVKVFKAYLHVQYFRGWGETLIDYNVEQDDQVRIGLMLYR